MATCGGGHWSSLTAFDETKTASDDQTHAKPRYRGWKLAEYEKAEDRGPN